MVVQVDASYTIMLVCKADSANVGEPLVIGM